MGRSTKKDHAEIGLLHLVNTGERSTAKKSVGTSHVRLQTTGPHMLDDEKDGTFGHFHVSLGTA